MKDDNKNEQLADEGKKTDAVEAQTEEAAVADTEIKNTEKLNDPAKTMIEETKDEETKDEETKTEEVKSEIAKTEELKPEAKDKTSKGANNKSDELKENDKKETTDKSSETVEDTSSEEGSEKPVKKVRTVHGQQIDLEEVKEKEEGLKFDSFKERVAYLWDYYKWTVGVAVALGLIGFMLIRSVIIEMKPPIIYIAMMNAHMDSPGDATYGDDYGNERGLNPKTGRITMDVDFVYPMTIDDAALKNDTVIASIQRFTAAITNANIDIVITNPWVLKDCMENELFNNLQEVYTDEEIKAFDEQDLLWYEADLTGNLVPVGVKINGHRDIDSFYNGEVIVIGIPKDSKRVERAKDFIAWMLEG